MLVEIIRSGGCRSYLIGDPQSRLAAIIDPKDETVEEIHDALDRLGLVLIYAIDTHTHADHISACSTLAKNTIVKHVMGHRSPLVGLQRYVRNDEELPLGDLRLKIIETPGHTADSMCILVNECLFTGDTLLIGSVGRTDLPTGNAQQQFHSIFRILAKLPSATRIFPGHDYKGLKSSTIGDEFKSNPKLQVSSEAEFIARAEARCMPPPERLRESLLANMGVA